MTFIFFTFLTFVISAALSSSDLRIFRKKRKPKKDVEYAKTAE